MTTDEWPKQYYSGGRKKLRSHSGSLYGLDIFEGLESGELNMLFDNTHIQTYPVGTTIFSPDDTCKYLYLLGQGGIELYRLTSEGNRIVTRRILPGSMFGIMGLLGQTVQGSFAEATEDSTVYIMSLDDILTFLRQRPALLLNMLEAIGNRLCLLEERLIETLCSPINIRLAHFLLANADPVSGILDNITHEEIGHIVGAVRQTVTEALSQMRNQGLVLTGFKRVQIIDRHGLEEIVRVSESRLVPDFTTF